MEMNRRSRDEEDDLFKEAGGAREGEMDARPKTGPQISIHLLIKNVCTCRDCLSFWQRPTCALQSSSKLVAKSYTNHCRKPGPHTTGSGRLFPAAFGNSHPALPAKFFFSFLPFPPL